MLNANSLQDQIKYIRSLPDLTDAEKTKKISETMRTWTTKKASQVKEKEDAKEKEGPNCSHYLRNCDVQCPDCSKFYPCRVCHDEAESHALRRHDVTHVRCRSCKTVQSASNQCVMCGIKFGRYYCDKCHLWELGDSPIYHCDKCGICRKGKKEDYQHCDQCGMCYRKSVFPTHKCLQNCIRTNCPVCNEYMFDTRQEIMILKCGHSMHAKCLQDYSKHDYRCPLCKKSLVDMKEQWRHLDTMACMEQLPEDFKNKRLVISCNDCEKRSDISFSFEFRKCKHCKGYNTAEIECYETNEDVVSADSLELDSDNSIGSEEDNVSIEIPQTSPMPSLSTSNTSVSPSVGAPELSSTVSVQARGTSRVQTPNQTLISSLPERPPSRGGRVNNPNNNQSVPINIRTRNQTNPFGLSLFPRGPLSHQSQGQVLPNSFQVSQQRTRGPSIQNIRPPANPFRLNGPRGPATRNL